MYQFGADSPRAEAQGPDVSATSIAEAFNSFSEMLRKDEGILDWLIKKARKCVEIEADEEEVWVVLTPDYYEQVFAGEYGAELQLVIAVLKHNFGTFFVTAGGFANVARGLMTRTRSK